MDNGHQTKDHPPECSQIYCFVCQEQPGTLRVWSGDSDQVIPRSSFWNTLTRSNHSYIHSEFIFQNLCVQVLTSLEAETGIEPGWINNGGLFIANNKERLEEYKRLHTIGKVMGVDSYVLGPEETKKLYPLMNVSDIYGTLYSPKDGTIDPHGLCTALSRFDLLQSQ